jgi:hypothetical protein
MPKPLQPCGTRAAYMRHLRAGLRGEEIDFACRLANSKHNDKYKDETNNNRRLVRRAQHHAKKNALAHLARKYNEEFHVVYKWFLQEALQEERKKEVERKIADGWQEEANRRHDDLAERLPLHQGS